METVPQFVLSSATKEYDKIIGNVSLEYALQEMSVYGDLKQQAAIILSKSL